MAPGPSPQADGRQTQDKQLFVLGRVLHSSSHHSALTSANCAALLAADHPCTLIVFSIQMRQIGAFLLSVFDQLVFLTQSHVVKL